MDGSGISRVPSAELSQGGCVLRSRHAAVVLAYPRTIGIGDRLSLGLPGSPSVSPEGTEAAGGSSQSGERRSAGDHGKGQNESPGERTHVGRSAQAVVAQDRDRNRKGRRVSEN